MPVVRFPASLLALPFARYLLMAGPVALAAACLPSDSESAEPVRASARRHSVRVRDLRTPVAGALPPAAREYARARRIDLGLTNRDDFAVTSVRRGAGELDHVRMRQMHGGVAVWGSDVVVHARRGRFVSMNGSVTTGLTGVDTAPLLDANRALELARADYARAARDASAHLSYERERAELVIFTGAGAPRLTWHTEFFTTWQAGIAPARWNYFVDAQTEQIVWRFDSLHTLEQASGPGGNAKVSRTWVAELDVEPAGEQYAMDTARLRTLDLQNAESGGTLVTGPLQGIGDAAINDAHGFAEITLDMMQQWTGHNSIDDQGFRIVSLVHFGVDFENAFWDGAQMTYGDGAQTFYPLSGGIDVVAHEISHGFTEFHSALIYADMAGGLNESFSDVAGAAAEFFREGEAADLEIGEDIFIGGDSALRFMCDQTVDGLSIGHASDFYPDLDPHYSSGVPNKAFCRTARRLAAHNPNGAETPDSVRQATAIWFEANANYWTTSTTYTEGCQGTVDAARSLGMGELQIGELRDSWADVGVYCDGLVPPLFCDDLFTEDAGEIQSPNYPADYPDQFSRTYCIQPASGGRATLTFDAFNTESNYDFVTITDGATGQELSRTSGGTAPSPAESSILIVHFASDGSITASGWHATWTTTGGSDNNAPIADFSFERELLEFAFSDLSSDSDGQVVSWQWDFGDETGSASPSPLHAYVAEGTYDVSLTVRDDRGASNTKTTRVTASLVPDTDASPPDAATPDAGPPGAGDGDPEIGGCGCQLSDRRSDRARAPALLGLIVIGATLVRRRRRRARQRSART